MNKVKFNKRKHMRMKLFRKLSARDTKASQVDIGKIARMWRNYERK